MLLVHWAHKAEEILIFEYKLNYASDVMSGLMWADPRPISKFHMYVNRSNKAYTQSFRMHGAVVLKIWYFRCQQPYGRVHIHEADFTDFDSGVVYTYKISKHLIESQDFLSHIRLLDTRIKGFTMFGAVVMKNHRSYNYNVKISEGSIQQFLQTILKY